MELTIRVEGADAAASLRTALERAGDLQLSEVGDSALGVVAGPGEAATLAAALRAWLKAQPPGSELTVETGTQVVTAHAGDPRASIALTEAVTRAADAA